MIAFLKRYTAKDFKRMAFATLCGYIALLVILYATQRNFIYIPDRHMEAPEFYGVQDYQVVPVTTDDGLTLSGWYHAPSSPDRPVIVYFHGNGGSLIQRTERANLYAQAGYGVLFGEYRGYGGNPGKPSQNGLFSDARAYIDWLRARGVAENNIILYGESLGTGVATYVAAEYATGVRGLVLESPYTSLSDIGRIRFFFVPIDLLMKDKFDTKSRIGSVKTPILVLHGSRDMVVPFKYGERVFEVAPQPKYFHEFPEAGHNDLYANGAWPVVRGFIDALPQ
ncbi:alpha/beta hydrolase [Micavibrio aeruginosavorus]|uniref:alpha/beta hydrolase n=1 Tax=Micavibrio aeruginosavorus TaxID=349221 RepID=UPI003F4AD02F